MLSYTIYVFLSLPYDSVQLIAVYMRQKIRPPLFQIMACRLLGAKPSSEPILDYCQLYPK